MVALDLIFLHSLMFQLQLIPRGKPAQSRLLIPTPTRSPHRGDAGIMAVQPRSLVP